MDNDSSLGQHDNLMCVKGASSGDAKELGESPAEFFVRDFTTVGLCC